MQIAVYGGSFNPPHRAHGMVLSWLLESGSADAVWLVPVYRHAFEKSHGKVLADFQDRVAWCEALARPFGRRVEVSQVESQLPTPSYTVDTLEHLARTYPEHRFRLVVGADILEQVTGWRRWEHIEERFPPIVVGREGYSSPPNVPVFPAISSTRIRRLLSTGGDATGLLTPEVERMLKESHPWAG